MLHVHITRYPADHGLLCSVSTYKLHLEVTLWLRCGCIMSVSAGSTTRGEKTVCLQFLLLLEFSSSFPARALPALGATNSEKQRDTDLHVAKAIGNTLFCLLECSMTQILPVSPSPDVGEGWSLLIISWSRNVHPNSQARVSAFQQ